MRPVNRMHKSGSFNFEIKSQITEESFAKKLSSWSHLLAELLAICQKKKKKIKKNKEETIK